MGLIDRVKVVVNRKEAACKEVLEARNKDLKERSVIWSLRVLMCQKTEGLL